MYTVTRAVHVTSLMKCFSATHSSVITINNSNCPRRFFGMSRVRTPPHASATHKGELSAEQIVVVGRALAANV
jgi:hypothetical protein